MTMERKMKKMHWIFLDIDEMHVPDKAQGHCKPVRC
jgi:hypothetical protein